MKIEESEEIANKHFSGTKIFDPKSLLDRYGVVSIVASTGSGKTVFLTDCLSQIHTHFKHVFLFSKTAKLQKCYDFLDRSLIHDTFDAEFLDKYYKETVQKKLDNLELEPTLFLFDDICTDSRIRSSALMNDYYTGSRHLKISLWILSHSFTQLAPLCRQQSCWFVSFDLDSYFESDKMVRQYLSAESNVIGMKLFKKIVKEKPYQCIVIESHKSGASLEDKVKKFVANVNPKPFKIKEQTNIFKQKSLNTRPKK